MSGSKVVMGHFLGFLTEKRLHRHVALNNGTEPQLPGVVCSTSVGEEQRNWLH
jgi:hypothetical protein